MQFTPNGQSAGSFSQIAKTALGHATGVGFTLPGTTVEPAAVGLAISADGSTLVVTNNYNNSISVIDTATSTVMSELDLRPLDGTPTAIGTAGGTFPISVAIKGTTAYVGSDRDRQVVVVDISNRAAPAVITRISLPGNAQGMTLSADGSTLYVAQDNADQVAVINTATNVVINTIDTRGPASLGLPANTTGAAPASVKINPANNTLYAVNAGSNSVAVIPLSGPSALTTVGLIPTAYDPTDIAFSADGLEMYIVNGKSDTGPNRGYGYGFGSNTSRLMTTTYPDAGNGTPAAPYPHQTLAQAQSNTAANARLTGNNQYQFQLEHATLVSAQVPAAGDLAALTSQVAKNNGYTADAAQANADAAVMNFLRGKIQHVIYIVKENRTFDQILGDLGNGSAGDPTLTLFGKAITPNYHRLASQFVTLDNFMDPGDGSMDGWSWSMRGRVTNTNTVTQQQNYADVNRGLSYTGEGSNRNVPVNLPTIALRNATLAPTGNANLYSIASAGAKGGTGNLLTGQGDVAATDGPAGYQEGYIFNVLLNKGLTVRNYGWMAPLQLGPSKDAQGKPIKDPHAAGVVQTTTVNAVLFGNGKDSITQGGTGMFDPYFRPYDQNYPDVWRFTEWNREFQQFVANGQLPALSMIRGMSHDHTGSFGTAYAGLNAPELQQADNDAAVGMLVDAVAHSPYASNTLIIVIEDDCQDGADHIDSHRSTTYFVGPYVKKHAIVSTRFSQPNVLRTIEDIFGAPHVNLNTAYARPMADVFDVTSDGTWTYSATASTILKLATGLFAMNGTDMSIQYAEGPDVFPTHDGRYWQEATRGYDFSGEDRVPPDLYNKVLWDGLMEGKPFPGGSHAVTETINN